METRSEKQDTSAGFNQMDETMQPHTTDFGVQVFPVEFNVQTQVAIVPEVTHYSKN